LTEDTQYLTDAYLIMMLRVSKHHILSLQGFGLRTIGRYYMEIRGKASQAADSSW